MVTLVVICLFVSLSLGASFPGYNLVTLNKAAYGFEGDLSLLGYDFF